MECVTGGLNQRGLRMGICIGSFIPIQWKGDKSCSWELGFRIANFLF